MPEYDAPMRNPLSFSWIPLLPAVALAGGDAWYRQDDVVKASTRFQASAQRSQAAVAPVEEALVKADGNLASMDRAQALLRGSIPPAFADLHRATLDERAGRFEAEHQAIQERLTALELGFEGAYTQALERARTTVASQGFSNVAPCEGPSGIDALAMGGPGGGPTPPRCPGTDVSSRLAAAWDDDPKLDKELQALYAGAWPVVTSYTTPMEPVSLAGRTRAQGSFDPALLAASLPEAAECLDRIEALAQQSRSALSAARREYGESLTQEQLEAIRARARGVREWAEEQKSRAGKALLAAVERGTKGKGAKAGWGEVGACVNPPSWGGCAGPDRTKDVSAVLLGDQKLAKELKALLASLVAPPSDLP
jgi:hypothetical protein